MSVRKTSYNPMVVLCVRMLLNNDPANRVLIEQHLTNYIKLSHEKPYSEEFQKELDFLNNYLSDTLKKMGVQ